MRPAQSIVLQVERQPGQRPVAMTVPLRGLRGFIETLAAADRKRLGPRMCAKIWKALQKVQDWHFENDPKELCKAPETMYKLRRGDCEDYTRLILAVAPYPGRAWDRRRGSMIHIWPELHVWRHWLPVDLSAAREWQEKRGKVPLRVARRVYLLGTTLAGDPGWKQVLALSDETTLYELVQKVAQVSGLPVGLMVAIVTGESNWDPFRKKGQHMGLFQIADSVRTDFNQATGHSFTRDDVLKPKNNAAVAAWIFPQIKVALTKAMGQPWDGDERHMQLVYFAWLAGWSERTGVAGALAKLRDSLSWETPAKTSNHALVKTAWRLGNQAVLNANNVVLGYREKWYDTDQISGFVGNTDKLKYATKHVAKYGGRRSLAALATVLEPAALRRATERLAHWVLPPSLRSPGSGGLLLLAAAAFLLASR